MDNQDEWLSQLKRLDANQVVIVVVLVAALGILIQALLLYLLI